MPDRKPLAPPNPSLPKYQTREDRLAAFYGRVDAVAGQRVDGEATLTFNDLVAARDTLSQTTERRGSLTQLPNGRITITFN